MVQGRLNSFIQRQTMMFTKFQKKRASTSWRLWRAQQKTKITKYYMNMKDDDKKKSTRKIEEKQEEKKREKILVVKLD